MSWIGKTQIKQMRGKLRSLELKQSFLDQCAARGLPVPVTEYAFWPGRRFRFDFALLDSRIAIEVEGGHWIAGRHNRGSGFVRDIEKYAEALILGWRVLRVTSDMVDDGRAVALYARLLSQPEASQ